jgi:hypothetical protein
MSMSAPVWQRDPGSDKPQSPGKVRVGVGTALRYMYKPRLGQSLGEIGRNNGMFTRMIAGVFASQGLFPKNHPALRDETQRLPLTGVLTTAFNNLNWTKDGVPQILFFFAVIGTIVFSTIGFFVALASMFTSQAQAAPGILDSPFPLQDVGNKWLEHIFNDGDFAFTNNTTNAQYGLLGTDFVRMPQIIRQIAAFYSNAMLILASIILIYHLISMIAATAHEGVAMGRNANQIWAPIRLVFALGLLVPVAGGWSSGQWLVMQIAKWGSGMASNIWNVSSNFPPNVAKANPDIQGDTLVANLMGVGACLIHTEHSIGPDAKIQTNGTYTASLAGIGLVNSTRTVIDAVPTPAGSGLSTLAGAPNFFVTAGDGTVAPPDRWGTGANCAKITTPGVSPQLGLNAFATWGTNQFTGAAGPDGPNMRGIATAYIAAYNAIAADAILLGAAEAIKDYRIDGANGICGVGAPIICGGVPATYSRSLSITALKTTYRNTFLGSIGAIVVPKVAGVAPGYIEPAAGQFVYDEAANNLSYKTANAYVADPRGWMTAGSFFMDLATKAKMMDAFMRLGVNVQATPGTQEAKTKYDMDMLGKMEALSNEDYNGALPGGNLCAKPDNTGTPDFFKKLVYCVGFIPFGIMQSDFTMNTGRLFAGAGNHLPFSDMHAFGGNMIEGATTLIKMGLALNAASAAVGLTDSLIDKVENQKKASAIGKFLKAAGISGGVEMLKGMVDGIGVFAPMLISFGVMLFIPGFMLFYLLPMLPFINFVMGCITWVVSVLQAVIAIPVIAIAHITPNGEGLPSSSARGAYLMLLQIFLRPIMMVFGFLVCVLIVNTGLVFASMLYLDNTTISMIGADPMSQLIGFVLYAGLSWGIVHAAITCIDEFPLKAVSWIGGGSVDANHPASNAVAGVLASTQAMNQISGGLGGLRIPGGERGRGGRGGLEAAMQNKKFAMQAQLASMDPNDPERAGLVRGIQNVSNAMGDNSNTTPKVYPPGGKSK